jgi:chemotaxis protein MotA
MDIATVLGLVLVIAAMFIGIGSNMSSFINIPSLVIVVVGDLAAIIMSFPLNKTLDAAKNASSVVLFRKDPDYVSMVRSLVSFSEKARKEGLLALEDDLANVEDEYMKKGLQLVIDGTDPELVRGVMEAEMDVTAASYNDIKALFDAAAEFGPAYGMLGTLIGLIILLKNLSNPDTLGPSMAVALITTFYGSLIANALGIPLAHKVETAAADKLLEMQIVLEGVLSIQAGDNPRLLEEKLKVFLPAKDKAALATEGE